MERNKGLITNIGLKSPISEAYRSFRTNLEFISPDNPLRTLLLTSSGPGEGKSLTIANLGIAMAQKGRKVILLDCDLRKPVQHKVFSLSNYQGITNYLIDSSLSIDDVIQNSGINNLDVIPCGQIPPNPAELLGSTKMRNLLNKLKENYNLVLLDTPPVISVTDAAILSSLVDGVVLVISEGKADKAMVQKAHKLLKNVEAKILGVVLNRVKIKKGYESYYYYYGKGEEYSG